MEGGSPRVEATLRSDEWIVFQGCTPDVVERTGHEAGRSANGIGTVWKRPKEPLELVIQFTLMLRESRDFSDCDHVCQ